MFFLDYYVPLPVGLTIYVVVVFSQCNSYFSFCMQKGMIRVPIFVLVTKQVWTYQLRVAQCMNLLCNGKELQHSKTCHEIFPLLDWNL